MFAFRRTALFAAAVILAGAAGTRADEPVAPPAAEHLTLLVDRMKNRDCPLHTEVTLNGKSLGEFQSTTHRDLSGEIRLGTNTISFTTTPQEPAGHENSLSFEIGVVTMDPMTKKSVVKTVLLRYHNNQDWQLNGDTGKYTHPFGPNPKTPDRKSVTHTYTFEYVGAAADLVDRKEGSYFLQVEPMKDRNVSVISTLTLNGKPLGSFLGSRRALDVSRLLKAGENEIKLTTNAVANQLYDNDTQFEIIGPLSYDVAKSKFMGKRVVQFRALEGWARDSKTAQLHVKGSPDKTSYERVIRFTLNEAPK